MKRDMDLIREILFQIEAYPKPMGEVPLDIKGYSPEEISYHVKLLAQAGLIEALEITAIGIFEYHPKSLTWEGHEFLDKARNENIWEKAKKLAFEKTGGLSLEAVKIGLTLAIESALKGG